MAVPIVGPQHELDDWHLCSICFGFLKLGLRDAEPGSMVAYLTGSGLRLTPTDVRNYVTRGTALAERRVGREASTTSPCSVVLTPIERDVLARSASGLRTAEVADALGASPNDVRTTMAGVIAKLGAHSKLEAVIIALRFGEITI
jgi:DNA-binding CsgD family transcriptional regulator